MKLAAILLTSLLAFRAPVEKSRVYVLCYHGFMSDSNQFSFQLDELRSQLNSLQKNGFNFVSLSDVTGDRVRGYKNILVSVDDGNRTVYQAYRSVFKPLGIKPVLGIYPAIISVKNYALTWDQLKELSDEGCEIAAHGYNHLFVNDKLNRSNHKAFLREIYTSKSVLEKKLGKAVNIFIYPFGVRSEVTRETLKAAGYTMAFTIEPRRLNPLEVDGPDRFELPRFLITRTGWKGSMNSIVHDSTSSRPAAIARVRKPAETKKGPGDSGRPLVEPRIYRDRYIYQDDRAEEKPGRGFPGPILAGFSGQEKMSRSGTVKKTGEPEGTVKKRMSGRPTETAREIPGRTGNSSFRS